MNGGRSLWGPGVMGVVNLKVVDKRHARIDCWHELDTTGCPARNTHHKKFASSDIPKPDS